MKVKVYGVNTWSSIPVFLHQDLKDKERPTPFMAIDFQGNSISSKLRGNLMLENRIKDGEVELIEGDYIMMLPLADLTEYKESACGHIHYYTHGQLFSCYDRTEYENEDRYISRKLKEERSFI